MFALAYSFSILTITLCGTELNIKSPPHNRFLNESKCENISVKADDLVDEMLKRTTHASFINLRQTMLSFFMPAR